MAELSEVSLKAWIEATWFKGLARSAMILGAAATGWIGAYLVAIDTRTATVEGDVRSVRADVEDVSARLAQRALDNERFQSSVSESFVQQQAELEAIKLGQETLQRDIAQMRGMVQTLQALAQRAVDTSERAVPFSLRVPE